MRLNRIVCALLYCAPLVSGACAKGSQPASPVSRDGGETEIDGSCEALEHKVSLLYEQAAKGDGVAANLQGEFVSANVTMVMNDCQLRPAVRISCLQEATTVAEVESKCLEYLDDQGTVEGYRFAGTAPQ